MAEKRSPESNFGRGRLIVHLSGFKSVKTELTLLLPSANSSHSQPFQEKCISDVVIGCIIIFHLSNKPMKSQVLHITV